MSDDYPGTRSGRDVVYDYAERMGRWAPQAVHDPRPPTEAPGRVAGVLVCPSPRRDAARAADGPWERREPRAPGRADRGLVSGVSGRGRDGRDRVSDKPADIARRAVRSLDAITEPFARAILDHHTRRASLFGSSVYCMGCDMGCSCEQATWPCSTVALVADRYGIEMTEPYWSVWAEVLRSEAVD